MSLAELAIRDMVTLHCASDISRMTDLLGMTAIALIHLPSPFESGWVVSSSKNACHSLYPVLDVLTVGVPVTRLGFRKWL